MSMQSTREHSCRHEGVAAWSSVETVLVSSRITNPTPFPPFPPFPPFHGMVILRRCFCL